MEKKESAKERILQTATALFYAEGVRAVGIDRIIEESGVAKASFYRNFATKDELVVAYLEQHHNRIMGRIEEARSRYPDDAYRQLLELFRRLSARFAEPAFRGCPFMNTTIEFPDPNHPGHRMAVASRLEAWTTVAAIAREAGARDPEALTNKLEVAYSGAVMTSLLYPQRDNGAIFYDTVRLLIMDHMPHPPADASEEHSSSGGSPSES